MQTGTSIQPRYSPRFRVDVGDTTFQEPGGRIADLVVETTLDGADRFSFTLNFPFDEELGEFSGLTWDDFAIGTAIEIAMGYGGDGTLTPLLTGSIRSINAEFTTDRGPSVTVSGYGLLWELMQGTGSNSWTETTVGEAVSDVLSSYSFSTVDVSDASINRKTLIQDGQSDYRFVQQLAETYGFEFYAERDTVGFDLTRRKPRTTSRSPNCGTARHSTISMRRSRNERRSTKSRFGVGTARTNRRSSPPLAARTRTTRKCFEFKRCHGTKRSESPKRN